MHEGRRRPGGQRAAQEARRRDQSLSLDRPEALPLTASLEGLRTDLLAIVHAGLRACDPAVLLARAFSTAPPWPADASVYVVAAGKAAPLMAAAATQALSRVLRGGVVVAPEPFTVPAPLEAIVAGHPVPTPASELAGQRALAIAAATTPRDHLLVLLSGGASALLAAPADGVTLDDKRRTTYRLLTAGADIFTLNVVRKHLSAVKGGQLAARAAAASRTFAISDVVGDDLSVIGSGPTVADPSTFAEAIAALERSGGTGAFPSSVVARLAAGASGALPETPKPGDSRLARASADVIGGRQDAMAGAASEARRRGYRVVVHENPVTGEARVAGPAQADALRRLPEDGLPWCAISSGETTVRVTGSGRGGRNQEFALGAAAVLAQLARQAVCASIGTDGIDGPTDAAGAIVDSETLERARCARLAPDAFLANNDAYAFFDALGDLVKTGPSGTNVGDLQVFLVA